jgi:hypothetical protein
MKNVLRALASELGNARNIRSELHASKMAVGLSATELEVLHVHAITFWGQMASLSLQHVIITADFVHEQYYKHIYQYERAACASHDNASPL